MCYLVFHWDAIAKKVLSKIGGSEKRYKCRGREWFATKEDCL